MKRRSVLVSFYQQTLDYTDGDGGTFFSIEVLSQEKWLEVN